MGNKYEIIGREYPYKGYDDLHYYTNSWFRARKLYRKVKKKMYYTAFIVRNDKKKSKE